MVFDIRQQQDSNSDTTDATTAALSVDLTMSFEPENLLLGRLAIPVLTVDNALALKLLLPAALRRAAKAQEEGLSNKSSNGRLEEFRLLMGTLDGLAGVAHLVDCLALDSKLLVAVGSPPFGELPAVGQALAVAWCAAGPLAFVLSRIGLGDAGLVLYGAVEVACAALVHEQFLAADAGVGAAAASSNALDPLVNAIGVQAAVLTSWFYSASKGSQPSE